MSQTPPLPNTVMAVSIDNSLAEAMKNKQEPLQGLFLFFFKSWVLTLPPPTAHIVSWAKLIG